MVDQGVRPSEKLEANRSAVLAAIGRWRVGNPRVFGSVARGDDDAESDLDVLVDAVAGTRFSDLDGLEEDLSVLLGVKVDVVTSGALHRLIRDRVLLEARPI
jgi:uncharacterized protein